jgi:NAD(P)-dependent dehydrogenase (short-subunit alcohol dehydrogenase family)
MAPPSQSPLAGAVAVVTGASGRLGPVWIEALADAGATVVGLDLQEADGVLAADVTDRPALDVALRRIEAEHGTPTVLVNNAGIDQPPGPTVTYRLEEIPLEVFGRVLDVNLLGAFQASQVFASAMLRERRGSIINIGSLYASVSPDVRFYDHLPADPPFLKPPAYGASKAALVNLTRYLATHWGPQGVRVNALSPGGVEGGQDPEFKRKFTGRVPLGRMAAADDLRGPLIFLASDASSYVTGVDLVVDGGFTSW